MNIIRLSLLATLLCSLTTSPAAGQEPVLELGSPFVDDMILQRGMPVPVWGWGVAGEPVTVAFAGQRKTATAGPTGKWALSLDPLEASGEERTFVVSCTNGERIRRNGVLVGEVWFASGQSNMDWIAGKSMCRELADRMRRSKDGHPVREYAADTGSALFVRGRTTSAGGWKRSQHAGQFSALALAFAWELHEQLGVPVGILRSTHGATSIEPWTSYEGFAGHPDLQHIATKVRSSDPTTEEGRAAYTRFYGELRAWQAESEQRIERGGSALPRPRLPGIAEEWKGATRMFNQKIAPLTPYAIRGVIWCQGTHNAGDGKIYAAKMEALIDGWRKNLGRPHLPFYFTQMQCYGQPDVNNVGFADIREAQRRFFMDAKNVGMVLQHDLNPARPTGIHYYNKLDPGKRLARWALAHQYGRDIPYTGPIYRSHSIEGAKVRVRFEQRGKGGGLMVGTKGMEADARKSADAYVEPAREAPGEALRHFRLAGKDRVWHSAVAVIDGDHEIVVSSESVPEPVGVQYAYSASPIGANLYNRAGLPATPFASFDGRQLFQEDVPAVIAKARAQAAARTVQRPYLQVASLFRAHAVIQRAAPVPVWGFARAGAKVAVRFGGQTKTATVDEFERWSVTLEPMPASAEGRNLEVACSDGPTKSVPDIVVGDVWFLTGSTQVSGELIRSTEGLTPLPLVREFRIRTKARRFREPRKRRMEIGGGKYVSSWRAATLTGDSIDTSVAGYFFAAQVRQPGVPVGLVTLGADNPPLTWVSYEGLQTARGFEKERDELNLLYPNTTAGKAAVTDYIATLERYTREVQSHVGAGRELPDSLAKDAPVFPQPQRNQWAKHTENATLTYNFCISPLTPCAVRGVVWIPGQHNIGVNPARYAPALQALAHSLSGTYGQSRVPFSYAQPSPGLATGISIPKIDGAVSVPFDAWPKSLREIATRLGKHASQQ